MKESSKKMTVEMEPLSSTTRKMKDWTERGEEGGERREGRGGRGEGEGRGEGRGMR